MNDAGVMEQVDWSNLTYRGGTAGSPEEFERYRGTFRPDPTRRRTGTRISIASARSST
jgi:hypothetical protein